jgi:divalent metal cation (Fe/Co/Zn/Cd) transporter
MDSADARRPVIVRRGQRLEYFTLAWNSLEALVSMTAGIVAGSVALVGFGADSLIEVASGAALLWRLHHDLNPSRREQVERTTLRIVGWCFITLAAYIVYESGSTLIRHEAPEESIAGIIIAIVSLVAMPLLARAKRRVAIGMGSAAMHADSRQTDFCAYLSAILLGGLVLNAAFGWWWADPLAGIIMVPIIMKEGVNGLKSKVCCGNCGCQSSPD